VSTSSRERSFESIGATAALKCCAIDEQNGVERTVAIVLSWLAGDGAVEGAGLAFAIAARAAMARSLLVAPVVL
jgi:hypothetical protein